MMAISLSTWNKENQDTHMWISIIQHVTNKKLHVNHWNAIKEICSKAISQLWVMCESILHSEFARRFVQTSWNPSDIYREVWETLSWNCSVYRVRKTHRNGRSNAKVALYQYIISAFISLCLKEHLNLLLCMLLNLKAFSIKFSNFKEEV